MTECVTEWCMKTYTIACEDIIFLSLRVQNLQTKLKVKGNLTCQPHGAVCFAARKESIPSTGAARCTPQYVKQQERRLLVTLLTRLAVLFCCPCVLYYFSTLFFCLNSVFVVFSNPLFWSWRFQLYSDRLIALRKIYNFPVIHSYNYVGILTFVCCFC